MGERVMVTEIRGSIEFFWAVDEPERWGNQCARCGSSVDFVNCANCGGEGDSYHDCGEDSCCCVHPENNVACDWCDGEGGAWHCVSTPEYCNANPIAGRESIESTAMRSEAWSDA